MDSAVTGSSGTCHLFAAGVGVIPGSSRTLSIPDPGAGPSGFSLVAVTPVMFGDSSLVFPVTLECNQESGDISYSDEQISAVALSSN